MRHIKHICSIHDSLHCSYIQQVRRQRERNRIKRQPLHVALALQRKLVTGGYAVEDVGCSAAAGCGGLAGGREGEEGRL